MKTTRSILLVSLVTAATTLGCSSSSSNAPATHPGTVNSSQAASSTQTTIAAVTEVVSPAGGGTADGQDSATQLETAAESMGSVITPGTGTAAASVRAMLREHPFAVRPELTGTCSCAADSCTFTDCSDGTLTINGTYSWGGGNVVSSLTYVYDGGASTGPISIGTYNITLNCNLTVTATSLSGTLESKGSLSASEGSASYGDTWDTNVTFNGVTWAAGGGSPTGGSASISGTYDVNAGGVTDDWSGSATVTFPAQ